MIASWRIYGNNPQNQNRFFSDKFDDFVSSSASLNILIDILTVAITIL